MLLMILIYNVGLLATATALAYIPKTRDTLTKGQRLVIALGWPATLPFGVLLVLVVTLFESIERLRLFK